MEARTVKIDKRLEMQDRITNREGTCHCFAGPTRFSALYNDFGIVRCMNCMKPVDRDAAENFIDYNTEME